MIGKDDGRVRAAVQRQGVARLKARIFVPAPRIAAQAEGARAIHAATAALLKDL